ncbi:LOW QUALITY PROTEIN: hypothetical protein Cgig2_021282 [Carnegiea gigantea]|uniref:Uncharacterized protein n=1 Tax=Carnegiea gigantea TaxID=171969 RepID=A0A9Q1GHP6_9CARY|nr:LOW QUALITY PROTEIN: hypothetical protein Cgig2_021282 [Carnegiea gigantea]
MMLIATWRSLPPSLERSTRAQIQRFSQVMSAKELKPVMGPTITFGPEDMRPLQTPHNDALVIQLKVATAIVRRILMDIGSLVDIITLECLKKLYEKSLEAAEAPIIGLRGQPTKEEPPSGETSRPPKIGKKSTTEAMVVLSASTKEHRRPRPEPTSKGVSVSLDPTCLVGGLKVCHSILLWKEHQQAARAHPRLALGLSSSSDLAGLLEEAGFYSGPLTTTVSGIPAVAEGPRIEFATNTFHGYDTGLSKE